MGEICALCKELENDALIMYKDDYCFGVVAKWPLKKGHILVVPLRHLSDVSQLSEKESKAIFQFIGNLQKALPKLYGRDVIVIQNPNHKRTEGHIHFHVLPSIGGIRDLFSKYEGVPNRKESSYEDMAKMAEEIRVEIGG
jgi:diadenosine tetraphosphate (Ap4A) HIT family hydrolase